MRDSTTTWRRRSVRRLATLMVGSVSAMLAVSTGIGAMTGPISIDAGEAGGGTTVDGVHTWVVTRPDGGIPTLEGCDRWQPAADLSIDVGPGDLGTIRQRPDGIVEVLHWRDCEEVWQYAWIPLLDPGRLADEARREIAESRLPRPTPTTSPPRRTIVNLDTWLAVVAVAETTATAHLPDLSSTVTARIDRTVFRIGSLPIADCPGTGSMWTPAAASSPATCSHVFVSIGEVVLTATTSWRVTWTSSAGTGGVLDPIALSGSIPLTISEIQTIGTG